ncbi:hypothetical protein MNBD_NITROSPINAE02-1674 [hydrothermal vent metagenome]|uniref:Uncharacterized protein n=1 Tax=hydrothermal vent metagenome TaxID=652676 RepID=A0A3B1C6B6_9ZZZZ
MKIIYSLITALAIVMTGAAHGSQYDKIDNLKEQILEIQNTSKLGIRSFALCRKIIGYGVYVPYSSNVIPKGSVVYFYYEVNNIFTSKSKDGYSINFSQDAIVADSKGKVLMNMPKVLKFNYNSNKPALNFYTTFKLDLSSAPPGDYIYKIVLYDELRGSVFRAELPFSVK